MYRTKIGIRRLRFNGGREGNERVLFKGKEALCTTIRDGRRGVLVLSFIKSDSWLKFIGAWVATQQNWDMVQKFIFFYRHVYFFS